MQTAVLMYRMYRTVFFVSLLVGLAVVAGQAEAARARSTPSPDVLDQFDATATQIEVVSSDEINEGNRNSLARQVASAHRAYQRGQACTAANVLAALMSHAQALRKGKGVGAAEGIFAAARSLRLAVIGSAEPSEQCADPTVGEPTSVDVLASDNTHFSANLSFGALNTWAETDGGEVWTQLSLPSLDNVVGAPGMPAIPTWQAIVGIPAGATAHISSSSPVPGESFFINLYPFQQGPVDQSVPDEDEFPPDPLLFVNPPFEKDEEAYATDAFFPPSPCAFQPLGQYRDLQIGQVQCAAGQYNPVTDEFRTFDSVAFDIQFEGGEGTFITSQSLSPFELSNSGPDSVVLNSSAVVEFVKEFDLSDLICWGEELLILTHPNFRDAADELADWKRDKGIATTVINVGAGTLHSNAGDIDDLIEDRYGNCQVRPSYVLLIGDSEWIPPSDTDYQVSDDSTTGSDFGYAIYPQGIFDIFPDFAVGRIPVDTLAEAQTVVDKTINYESSPPFINLFDGGPFYTTAGLAAQFQCCRMNQDGTPLGNAGRTQRSFIHSAETARDALMADGFVGESIYTETVDNGGYCLINPGPGNPCPTNQIQQPYSGNTTPNRYYDNTLLPTDLRSGSGFPWDGSTADIISAFNEGRFLFLHRDHGGSSGWSNPLFSTANLSSLSNGDLLPIVYSVNCKSGYFDRETDTGGTSESFMERMLMLSGGGMVGGLGDVRNSPSWENSALTRGYFDATWPNVAPGFGGSSSIRRLGDILDHGKLYLMSQVGVAQPAGAIDINRVVDEWIMWHTFGDPTLEMWVGNPHRITLPVDLSYIVQDNGFVIDYVVDGATITALQQTKEGLVPVGRAVVESGEAVMPFFIEPQVGAPIIFSASLPGAVSVVLREPGTPDLVVDSIGLPSPALVHGQDLSLSMTLNVKNQGAAVAAGTVNADGTVKGTPGYNVDLVLSKDDDMPFGFANVPLPAGVAFADDGLLQSGRLSRTVDVGAGVTVSYPIGAPVSSDLGGIVPTQTPQGPYFLCARVDPGDEVAESDENNNVTCIPVRVEDVIPGPD